MSRSSLSEEQQAYRDEIRGFCKSLEISDKCRCAKSFIRKDGGLKLLPPCKHVLQRDHNVSLERWHIVLSEAYPKDFYEPPDPPESTRDTVPGTLSRVDVYQQRVEAGFHWHHVDDVKMSELDRVGTRCTFYPNGRIKYYHAEWQGGEYDE